MRVTYLRGALRDLNSIFEYISADDPIAAHKVIRRIREVADLLGNAPHLGRAGQRGRRFLSVAGLPYVVIHRIQGESVQIVAIFHTARNRLF
jgi:toxin ParE1/3/4